MENGKTDQSNKSNSWVFGKINKINNLLAYLIKKIREKIYEIYSLCKIMTDTEKTLQRYYSAYVYANIVENFDKINIFLGWDSLPKLFSEKMGSLNRLICVKEIEVSSRNYHMEKQQGQVVL